MQITISNGVVLISIPESPNDDYMAGSDGQVYSQTRYKGFGRKDYVDWYPLKGHKTKKGYNSVSLCHENKKITRCVHRLVCSAFNGPPPFKSALVRHLDGNPQNNVPANLKWGTQIENWQDRIVHGRGMKGEKHPASKFGNFERKAIRWAVRNGLCSRHHAARVLTVSQSAISGIVLGSED